MQVSTREARLGPDDGTDSCRQQAVALDSTGNFFAADIMAGAAYGALGGGLIGGLAGGSWKDALIGAGAGAIAGAASGYWNALQRQRYDEATLYSHVEGDLSNDNAQISRTQYAFDQLMACRFQQAAGINAALAAGQTDRATAMGQMQSVRALAQRDLALAKSIDTHIQQRGQQFAVAANNIAPGAAAQSPPDAAGPAYEAVVSRQTSLRLSPNEGAPPIGKLPAKTAVRVTRNHGNYALVETDTGATGYAPVDDLRTPGKRHVSRSLSATSGTASGGDAAAPSGDPKMQVATLAGSNAARRDDFTQSVAVSEKAVASGFEVAG